MKRFLRVVGATTVLASIFVFGVILHVQSYGKHGASLSLEPGFSNQADVAMILGASVKSDGTPSDALRDRLEIGIKLYQGGNALHLLITGDDGAFHADEVDIMKKYLLDHGIPEDALLVDGHGYRTYESCKNTAFVMKENKYDEILIVTQTFHISRALYLCKNLIGGTNQIFGITSDLTPYRSIVYFTIRDWAASFKAWIDINVWPPKSPVRSLSRG